MRPGAIDSYMYWDNNEEAAVLKYRTLSDTVLTTYNYEKFLK